MNLQEKIQQAKKSVIDPKERGMVTENLATDFIQNNSVYTIRHDDKEEIWIYKEGIYIPQGGTYIKEFCREELEELFTSHLVNQVILKIETQTYIDAQDFFNNNNVGYICVENGILNIETRELTPHNPQKIFFAKLPVQYDPEADNPQIKLFLTQVLPHESDIEVMQEIFGFVLWTEYFAEKIVILDGDGRNGKSKTMEIMQRFLGEQNCTSITLPQMLKDQYSLGELQGSLVNITAENSQSIIKDSTILKSLTGRDMITAQRKFLSNLYFKNHAKLIFSFNKIPQTLDDGPAFFLRIVYLTFPYTFIPKEQYDLLNDDEKGKNKIADPHIVDAVCSPEEMSGLLNWSLKGLDRLRANGNFSNNKSAQEVEQWWVRKSDSFKAFIQDRVEIDHVSEISKHNLRVAYTKYCTKNNMKVETDRHIGMVLSSWGVSDTQRTSDVEGVRERVWIGVNFKSSAQLAQLAG